jgi:hypothetical protein
MDLVKLFLSADPRGADLVNLMLCALGVLWLVGIPVERRARPEWMAWLVFWFSTGAYYATAMLAIVPVGKEAACTDGFAICGLTGCRHTAAMPGFMSTLGPPFEQLGLYVATAALLWGSQQRRAGRDSYWRLPVLLVTLAALFDFILGCRFGVEHTGVHQTLTALAIGLFAWLVRDRDQSKSSALLLYALVQLPVRPLLLWLKIDPMSHSDFVGSTLGVYAALKLTIIPAASFVATKSAVGDTIR